MVLYHILGWFIYILIIVLGSDELDYDFIIKSISGILPVIAVFYLNTLIIFPAFLPAKKYFLLMVSLLLVMVITVAIRFSFSSIFPSLNFPIDSISFWNQFRMNFLFSGLSFTYWFALKNYQNESRWKQLEKDVAEAKLTILKNQINPHFLYNTLSLLYSKTLPLSEEVSELVAKIAEIMRYSLEGAEEKGLVPLEKEIAHLRNYVHIHQMRFGNNLNIDFEVSGELENHQIAPLLLITFVENAFKHGKFNEKDHPIKIKLEVMNRELSFSVENQHATGLKDPSSGIGLNNVKNRLQLLYPDHHSLDIKDDKQFYWVNLKIWKAA